MKRIGLYLILALLCYTLPQYGYAQRACGEGYLFNKLTAEAPATMQRLREQHDKLIHDALANANNANAKASALNPIPLVFHFVVTDAQYYALGRDSGIKRRVNSQIAALNKDFNGTNPDRSKVPTPWVSRFGTAGVQFGLANATSANTIAPGIELRRLTSTGAYTYWIDSSCSDAKTAAKGLAPWNNTKYLNIWVVNIYGGVSNTILGVTVPPSFVGQAVPGYTFIDNDKGIVINYSAIGSREFPTQSFYPPTIDRGRTLTHEMGHYFEIWHVWGDDNGNCPPPGSGYDDGIPDTPPQADHTYCTSSGVCPTFPRTDLCSPSGNGIMFMNYMDYTDDSAMFMFTVNQVQVMQAQFNSGGESYSLTQQPGTTAVGNITTSTPDWSVSPNPTNGAIHLNLDVAEGFKGAHVLNMMGQVVASITRQPGVKLYELDLSTAPRGIYVVQCVYEGATTSKRLVLE